MSYIDIIKEIARSDRKTIVLPETNDKRTLIAASHIIEEGIANIIMVGNEEKIMDGAGWLEVDLTGVRVIDPTKCEKLDEYVQLLYETRKHKGMTPEKARQILLTDNMTFSDTTVSLASWICMPKYGEENHDLLVRFTRALFKGMDYSANEHYDEVSEWVSKQTATDYESVYNQRGDAQWLTGKEVAQGAADGTVAKYYELQRDNFVKAGAVEKDPAPDVSEYVLFDVMIEAGK